MSNSDFVHLHVHTEYSMLDGAARLDDLFAEANRLGQKAMAITDHGFLFGAFDFWKRANDNGIKPIIGLEAYLTPGQQARGDRTRVRWGQRGQERDDVSGGGAYTHMTLLAKSTAGMHNLFRLGSLSSMEGFFYKPRADRDLLQTYGEGLIATSGCPSGEVQTRLRLGQYDEARAAAAEFQDIFGKENFYIEVMQHGLEIEQRVIKDLINISNDIGAPLLATNDLHYTKPEDFDAHAALLCVQSNSTLADPNRFKFDANEFYLKSAAEMRDLWRDYPEACDNTLLVAEQCESTFDTTASYLPKFPVPEGEDETSYFIGEVERGLHRRYPNGIPDKVRKQANYEVEVITQMGFPGYFLVVADFIDWARRQGIRVGPGRGSAAGSMVSYVMGITDLDPLEHGLIFERFLNPERVSLPDVDVDFDERRRGEVIRYVTEKYGSDKVAQIVTYGTIKAKQAIKDASRVLGYPYSVGESLTKAMPPAVMGNEITLEGIFDPSNDRYSEAEEFRKLHSSDPELQRVVEVAKGLEGLKRQWGVHAAGVIMSSHPLMDIIPLMRREQDGAIITQFDQPTSETLGLLKMDFLGLRNLTILDDALANIERNNKPGIELESVPLDDRATYDLLSSGDTLGVFQLDSPNMRTLLRQMKPDNFEDITAVIALYRPGPMGVNSHTNYARRKNGLQAIEPIHPELEGPLEEIVGVTYGLIVYQEQVQRAAQKLAGYTLGQADLLRRAMGKKKPEVLAAEFVPFQQGMRERGYSDEAINKVWDVLVPFAGYAFNKAHAAAYGVISYWTGYLKANYRTEYMAALLTSVRDDKDKLALYLSECRHMGITVLPPDVNESSADFAAVGNDIRFGLGAVRNVGANVVAEIIKARDEKGNFTSFPDFLDKVSAVVCNRRTIESLIKAGAFDSVEKSRKALVAIHENAVESVVDVKRKEATGQFDLFAGFGEGEASGFEVSVPDIPEWEKSELLSFERQMLGLYVSDHPLNGLEHVLFQESTHQIADIVAGETIADGAEVKICGLISTVERRTSKAGRLWATVKVEDLTGEIEVALFGDSYMNFAADLAEDKLVAVRGRVRKSDDGVRFQGFHLDFPDTQTNDNSALEFAIPWHRCTRDMMLQLKDVLSSHRGPSMVLMHLEQPGKVTVTQLPQRHSVTKSAALLSDLRSVIGPKHFTQIS